MTWRRATASAGRPSASARPFQEPERPDTAGEVGIPLGLLGRRGLIGGATGTTRTLLRIAGRASAAGRLAPSPTGRDGAAEQIAARIAGEAAR